MKMICTQDSDTFSLKKDEVVDVSYCFTPGSQVTHVTIVGGNGDLIPLSILSNISDNFVKGYNEIANTVLTLPAHIIYSGKECIEGFYAAQRYFLNKDLIPEQTDEHIFKFKRDSPTLKRMGKAPENILAGAMLSECLNILSKSADGDKRSVILRYVIWSMTLQDDTVRLSFIQTIKSVVPEIDDKFLEENKNYFQNV